MCFVLKPPVFFCNFILLCEIDFGFLFLYLLFLCVASMGEKRLCLLGGKNFICIFVSIDLQFALKVVQISFLVF
jgi:hypothetical protein